VPTPWDEPPGSGPQISRNIRLVLRRIAQVAHVRESPTVARAQRWHREVYTGIARPFDYYAGEVRDSDPRFPDLIGYEVEVGGMQCLAAALVPAALADFESAARASVQKLDADIAVGSSPSTPRQLHGVLTLCAVLHGEWVRIHPFANGNGRTGRLWANWAGIRYGLPAFVTVRPRPPGLYGYAAAASMTGDHSVAVAAFGAMLQERLATLR
jgi:fido (protein-threonine AMPylation protein)